MNVRECVENVIWEIVYFIVTVIYLFKLNVLNKELLLQDFDGSFELLAYKNNMPLKFFAIATVLFFIGCILVYWKIRYVRMESDSLEEMLISGLAIIVVVMLLVLIVIFINNPILRAVFISTFVVFGIGYCNS